MPAPGYLPYVFVPVFPGNLFFVFGRPYPTESLHTHHGFRVRYLGSGPSLRSSWCKEDERPVQTALLLQASSSAPRGQHSQTMTKKPGKWLAPLTVVHFKGRRYHLVHCFQTRSQNCKLWVSAPRILCF